MRSPKKFYKLKETFVCLIGIAKIELSDVGQFINKIRSISDIVSIQALNANAVYGADHVLGVLKITLENERRGTIISSKPEIDLLLRMTYTDQISVAINDGGLKNFFPGCFILFSTNKNELLKVSNKVIKLLPGTDNTVIESNEETRRYIYQIMGMKKHSISYFPADQKYLTRYFIERSALIMR